MRREVVLGAIAAASFLAARSYGVSHAIFIAVLCGGAALASWPSDTPSPTPATDPEPTSATKESKATTDANAPTHELFTWIEPESNIQHGNPKTPRALNNSWSECAAATFKVRGKQYLTRKLKVPAVNVAAFGAVGVQNYMRGQGTAPLSHVASKATSLKAHMAAHPEAFFLIVGWMLPGPPFRTVLFVFQQRVPQGADPAFDALLREFLDGTDEQRKARFKYLPRLAVAPKMVLSGVRMIGGEKPTMLCTKLTSTFFRGPNYLEVNVDIASSKIANMVTGLIVPKIRDVVVEHAFILEGHTAEELPEKVLGSCRTAGVDMIGNTVIIPDDATPTE